MKIELHRIQIRKVIVGYKDSAEEGVVAYSGKLDIRPKYQREFVYKEKQRNAVIETIKNSFPLNVMYWMIRDDGGYEVLDGQQRTICAAYLLANDGGSLINGSPIRQEYLETALSWINDGNIEDYMAKHQHEVNADELWQYFQNVIIWVRKTFTKYRKEMKGVEWGRLYNKYRGIAYDTQEIEEKTLKLIDDDEVQSLKGIYEYILTGEEKHLNLRQFDDKTRRKVYEKQKGKCVWCKKTFKFEEMEADHITPWHEGGKTTAENCQLLCKDDNRKKSGK